MTGDIERGGVHLGSRRAVRLVMRLHERARSLGDGRAVLLKEQRIDRPVEQRSLGLDQVELSLNVEGLAEVQLT